ncbi:MAG TPA: lytic transglycosylase domain-containing protein [Blastocatellia bacterium]|nr:lytic transglycosylase domain-containing protein [Blastocatellia bacterium]
MKLSFILFAIICLGIITSQARGQEAGAITEAGAADSAAAKPRRTPTMIVVNETVQPVEAKPAPVAGQDKTVKGVPGQAAKAAAPQVTVTPPSAAMPGGQPLTYQRIPGMDTTGNPTYDALVMQAAARHGVDPNLIFAVMRQESGFHPRAVSYKGASGLMQLMPATARRFGVTNIFDPAQNIEAGTKYLRFLLDMFNGDVQLALAGYNAGEHAVVRHGYQIPRYRETQHYVRAISARYGRAKHQQAASKPAAPAQPVAPAAVTFANGRLSNNY